MVSPLDPIDSVRHWRPTRNWSSTAASRMDSIQSLVVPCILDYISGSIRLFAAERGGDMEVFARDWIALGSDSEVVSLTEQNRSLSLCSGLATRAPASHPWQMQHSADQAPLDLESFAGSVWSVSFWSSALLPSHPCPCSHTVDSERFHLLRQAEWLVPDRPHAIGQVRAPAWHRRRLLLNQSDWQRSSFWLGSSSTILQSSVQ